MGLQRRLSKWKFPPTSIGWHAPGIPGRGDEGKEHFHFASEALLPLGDSMHPAQPADFAEIA